MNELNSYDIPITNKDEKGGAVSTQGSLAYSKQHNGFPSFFLIFFSLSPPHRRSNFLGRVSGTPQNTESLRLTHTLA